MTGTVASVVLPSRNTTEPVGVPEPGWFGTMAASKWAASPNVVAPVGGTAVTVTAAGPTCWVIGNESSEPSAGSSV